MTYDNRKIIGTGILIEADLVLTCAHILFERENSKKYKRVSFYPGVNGHLIEEFVVESIQIPDAFYQEDSITQDCGLLKLIRQTDRQQFIKIATDENTIEETDEIIVIGYPASHLDDFDVEKIVLYQKGLVRFKNKIRIQNGVIYHCFPTDEGMSGCTIIHRSKENKMEIIGIHKGKIQNQQSNVGLLLSQVTISALKLKINSQMEVSTNLHQSEYLHQRKEQILLHKGNKLLKEKKWKDAVRIFQKIIQLNPQNKKALCNKALALLELNKFREAKVICQKCLEIDPVSDEALALKAWAHWALEQFDISIQLSLEALKQNEDNLTAYNILGVNYSNMGDQLTAITWFQRGLEKGSTLTKIKNIMKVAYCKLSKINNSTFVKFCNNIGFSYLRLERTNEAFTYLQRALELDPTYQYSYCNRGNLYLNNMMFKEAIFQFKEAILLDPLYLKAIKGIIRALMSYKKMQEALSYCQMEFHQNSLIKTFKGDILMKLKRFQEAKNVYLEVLEQNGLDGELCQKIGYAYKSLGSEDIALKYFLTSMKLNPQSNDYYNCYTDGGEIFYLAENLENSNKKIRRFNQI